MPEVRVVKVSSVQEYGEFLNRHKDLQELAKAKTSISRLKEQFEEELEQAEFRQYDSNTVDWFKDVVETLDSAWNRVRNVSNMLREIHIEEEEKEQTDGRTEE